MTIRSCIASTALARQLTHICRDADVENADSEVYVLDADSYLVDEGGSSKNDQSS